MNNDEKLLLLGFGAFMLILVVLMSISGIANSIESILMDIGVPEGTAADIGRFVFSVLLLGIIGGGAYLYAK